MTARRLPPYIAVGHCKCPCCAEEEQLAIAARWHPAPQVRMCALVIIDAVESVRAGERGALRIEQLFD